MQNNRTSSILPWVMLFIRSFLFISFQALVALGIFFFSGSSFSTAWAESGSWWMTVVLFANLVCVALLIRIIRKEGGSFLSIFRIDRQYLKSDLLAMLGILVLAGPISFVPNFLLGQSLFGNMETVLSLLIRPLPVFWALITFLFFPITQGLAEIPTYMIYVLPRLEKNGLKPWMSVGICGLFLSVQHIFLPFVQDWRWIVYRLFMFLPFAIMVAIVMRWRPRLMPYMAIMHALMDFSVSAMLLPLMI